MNRFRPVLLGMLLCVHSLTAATSDKPNILFILVDDFGARDLGCTGSTLYETPNIDRLAANGVSFTQAYVAYPRCVPSRFAIMTGKHPAPFQRDRDSVHVEAGRDETFGKAFQEAGYSTFYCGKWHLGDRPDTAGFTTTIAAGEAGATRSHFAPYDKAKGGGKGEKHAITGLEDAAEGEYLTDRLTDETIAFITEQKEKPFLAVLAHYAVHTPIEAKKHITKRYAAKLAEQDLPDDVYEPESAGENLTVQNNPTYASMIESVDKGVGRLIRTLKQLKLFENTIIVFTSDHGGLSTRGGKRELATSNRPYRAGKGHLYEGGLRVPMIVSWPGETAAGASLDTPVTTMDLFPTFLDMARLPAMKNVQQDGTSLVPLIRGEQFTIERPLFWHNPAPRPSSTGDLFSSAIRVGDYKLLQFPELNRVELYDLSSDVGEANNLAASHPDVRDDLLTKLQAWKQSVGAKDQPRMRKKEQRRASKSN